MKALITSVVAAAFTLAGCVVSQPSDQAIGAAQLAVREARQGEALKFEPTALQEAERRLTAAEEARRKGQETRARRLAEEAEVYARLAEARGEYEDTRRALADLEATASLKDPTNSY